MSVFLTYSLKLRCEPGFYYESSDVVPYCVKTTKNKGSSKLISIRLFYFFVAPVKTNGMKCSNLDGECDGSKSLSCETVIRCNSTQYFDPIKKCRFNINI